MKTVIKARPGGIDVAHEKIAAVDDLLGKVVRPADIVEYQKAAVVSRTLVDKKTGTVITLLRPAI